MKTTIGVALTIVGVVAVVLVIGSLKCGLDPVCRAAEQAETQLQAAQVAKLAPLDLWVGRILRGALIAVAVALALAALALVPAAWAYFPARAKIAAAVAWSKFGLPPWLVQREAGRLVVSGPGADPTFRHAAEARALMAGAEQLKVGAPGGMVGSADVPRLTAGVVRQLLNPKQDEALLPESEPTIELLPAQVLQPDPQQQSDTLVVGQKGGGKTNVLRYAINVYRRAMPEAEFLLFSTFASNWPGVPVISEPQDIYQAILALHDELGNRDRQMSAAGIADYHRWPDAPRQVVVVIDEAEALADSLLLQGRSVAQEFTRRLRIICNTGRNGGYMFILGTQTARADVLDPSFMHNAATLLMMRMDTATAARFAVYGTDITAQLPTLPTGKAYNPQHRGFVSFPLVAPIGTPRMSQIYVPRLALPVDAEADGLGADDLPDGATTATTTTSGGGHNGFRATPPVVGSGNGSAGSGARLWGQAARAALVSNAARAKWYSFWLAHGESLAAVEREFSPYHEEGGSYHYIAAAAINSMLRQNKRQRAGTEPYYQEERPS